MGEEQSGRGVRFWNVAVPKSLDDALEAAVGRVWHRTKTEFIREAVRRELERLGFKPSLGIDSQGQG
ncbi:MAG: ribbon-helix-helix protein, CopG family [Candidatus Bathyarchaeia archaeon]